MSLNAWIRMVRIHTACLTMAGAIIGLILAGETNWLRYFLFIVFALVFHATGFVANNHYDFKYDLKDKSKRHFPLITGEITAKQTRNFIIMGTIIGAILGIYLSNFKILAVVFLTGAIGFGFLYNISNKRMPYAGPIWISISFTCLPMFAYFSLTDAWSISFLFVVKYSLILMLWQISIEGNLKDILVPQKNILIELGTKVKDGWIRHSLKSRLFMGKLVALKIIVMGIFMYFTIYQWNIIQISIFALLLMILIDLSYEFGKDRKFDNTTIVRECALIEIVTYLLLITCLWCVIGWQWYVFLFCYPVAWFIFWNRVTWGTTLRPRV